MTQTDAEYVKAMCREYCIIPSGSENLTVGEAAALMRAIGIDEYCRGHEDGACEYGDGS